MIRILYAFIFFFLSQWLCPGFSGCSVFDGIPWKFVREEKGIRLFMEKLPGEKTWYYRAETKVSGCSADSLFSCLMDFTNYPKIFPRTFVFEKRNSLGKNRFLVYALLDFTPMKNRDYFVELCFSVLPGSGEKYVLEWMPAGKTEENRDRQKPGKVLRVENIYGRWMIEDQGSEGIFLSVEYHNDFKLTAPDPILSEFEKASTLDAIRSLLKYVMKK